MPRYRTVLIGLLVFFSFIGYSQTNKSKVLFVVVDGIPADVIEKISTPNLDAIAKKGGYSRAYVGGKKGGYSETPTISAVGYNSLLTGTWANKHNVWGNEILAPNYNYWTLFRIAKEHRPEIKTAIFSTWLDNRTKLVGENLEANGNFKMDYHFDGFENDTLNFPHDEERLYINKIDEHVVTEASRYIKDKAPDLSWVYLEYTDDMGHKFGDSEQFYDAVQLMDDQMGLLWQAIQVRENHYNENWEIFITTDHGRTSENGKGHGGQSERERLTWIVTNAKRLNQYFHKETPGIVDIMPSVLRTLEILPEENRTWEIDGVPLTGSVSLANADAQLKENELHLIWDAFQKNEKIAIWLATTDLFAKGGQDEYVHLGQVDLETKKATVDVSKYPSNFYKIVLVGESNAVNIWVQKK